MAGKHRPLGTVRARTTAGAVLVVGVALILGALVLLGLLRSSLTNSVDDLVRTRTDLVASLLHQGALPKRLNVAGEETSLIQVVDGTGHVVASSPNLEGEGAIARFVPSKNSVTLRSMGHLPIGSNGTFRVGAKRLTTSHGDLVVYAAVSLAEVQKSVSVLAGLLAFGVPIVLVIVGGTTALVVRRALRPVEAIRAEVADISGRDLHRRVPQPSSNDEIGRLALTMNAMLDRLESFNRRQQEFVADASHELQSPLTASRAEVEVALRHPDIADWSAVANTVLDEHDRMEHLIRDLLFLARDDDAAPLSQGEAVDLDEVVRDEIARLADRTRVIVDGTHIEGAEVRGNAERLAQVVRNLLENADRHARTRVDVELRSGDVVELVVIDDGPGVLPADRERIFERFVRADGSRQRGTGGSGLGLAITKRIVESHGGTISVDGDAPGARFVVQLPATR